MDDATLARLEHENMVAAIGLAGGAAPGARVEHTLGVALIATGLPLRLFNQVIVEADDTTADAILSAVATMRERGDRFVVNLRAGQDDRHLLALDALGLVPLSENPWMPGMAMHPNPLPGGATPGPGHEIRRVTDAAGVEDHRAAAAAGFALPRERVDAIVSVDLARHLDAALYVGYTSGRPVSTGLGVRTGRTIGVYNNG